MFDLIWAQALKEAAIQEFNRSTDTKNSTPTGGIFDHLPEGDITNRFADLFNGNGLGK